MNPIQIPDQPLISPSFLTQKKTTTPAKINAVVKSKRIQSAETTLPEKSDSFCQTTDVNWNKIPIYFDPKEVIATRAFLKSVVKKQEIEQDKSSNSSNALEIKEENNSDENDYYEEDIPDIDVENWRTRLRNPKEKLEIIPWKNYKKWSGRYKSCVSMQSSDKPKRPRSRNGRKASIISDSFDDERKSSDRIIFGGSTDILDCEPVCIEKIFSYLNEMELNQVSKTCKSMANLVFIYVRKYSLSSNGSYRHETYTPKSIDTPESLKEVIKYQPRCLDLSLCNAGYNNLKILLPKLFNLKEIVFTSCSWPVALLLLDKSLALFVRRLVVLKMDWCTHGTVSDKLIRNVKGIHNLLSLKTISLNGPFSKLEYRNDLEIARKWS